MSVFRLFFRTVRNNLPVLSIYLIAFLALSVLQSGSLRTSETQRFETSSLNVGIIDKDDSAASRALTKYLSSRHHAEMMKEDKVKNYDDLFYRYVDYILTIPDGFEEKFTAAASDGGDASGLLSARSLPSSSNAVFLDSQIDEFMTAMRLRMAAGSSAEEAAREALEVTENLPKVRTVSDDQVHENSAKPVWFFFRFLPYILINLLVLGIGAVMTALREEDFSRRVMVSSVRMNSYRAAVILAGICYAIIVWAVFFLASQILYPGQATGSALLMSALNTLVFTIVSLSIAVFASSIVRGSRRARTGSLNMISNVICLGMSFFCGVFVPLQFLGDGVKAVAHFLPAYWYIRLNMTISGEAGVPLTAAFVAKCLLIQLLMAAILLALSLLAEKNKR